MKAKPTTQLILFILLLSLQSFSQDTLTYRYKFGVKLISERSSDMRYDRTFGVGCAGVQAIRKIRNTKSSFESGVYFITKAKVYGLSTYEPNTVPAFNIYEIYYHYLTVPLNYRVDTKSIYFTAGIFADYLLYHSTDDEYLLSLDKYYGPDRKFFIGYNLNLGIEKSISYHMSIFAETRLAVTVSSGKTNDGGFIMTSGNIGSSNLNYGFGVGINYRLQRKLD